MTNAETRRLSLLALAIAAWLVCFAVFVRFGSWAVFALAGTTLVALALKFDPALPALLRPSLFKVGIGLGFGVAMVALTHAAFVVVTLRLPETKTATLSLYALLDGSGYRPTVRAAFVVVIASCEEILFRGVLAGMGSGTDKSGLRDLTKLGSLGRVVGLALCYAAATLTLGSALLAVCALLCGIAWGGLRVATRSLVSPITAHILWDLGIFLAWPLV